MQLTPILSDFDFKNTLNLLNIKKGDTLLIHSDIFGFGMPIITPQIYLQTLCNILFEVVGENGTIAMPTFTYSFCKGEIYDPQKSFSKMGSLNEFFRKNYAKRTLDPNFSYAIWGKKSDYLLNADTKETFGDDGIFARLRNINAKLLDIGNTRAWTFMHYAEKIAKVSYRFDKKFNGQICNNNKIYDTYSVYFVRHLDKTSHINPIDPFICISKTLKIIHINKCKFICFDLNEFFDFMLDQLRQNEEIFLIKN